jgi:predicted regulator of amino acid metabolism with ACT domain
MFPLVDNSIHLFLTPIARANDVAEDALQSTTQAITGDPQLAKNARNLTLFAGIGEVGKIAKIEEAVMRVGKTASQEINDLGQLSGVSKNDCLRSHVKIAGAPKNH